MIPYLVGALALAVVELLIIAALFGWARVALWRYRRRCDRDVVEYLIEESRICRR